METKPLHYITNQTITVFYIFLLLFQLIKVDTTEGAVRRCYKKNYNMKTSVLEYHFNNVGRLSPVNLFKRASGTGFFLRILRKFEGIPFLQSTSKQLLLISDTRIKELALFLSKLLNSIMERVIKNF